MTVAQHSEKIQELQELIDGSMKYQDRHTAARDILHAAWVNTLNEIKDEEVLSSIPTD
jgi:hypothetical protein